MLWLGTRARSNDQRDWRRLTEEFAGESDRAAALVAAALLDENLESLLKAYLIDDAREAEVLLGTSLQSLGARVRAAYLLGLISRDEMGDLRQIKEIRNHFAHHLHVSFQDSYVARACKRLRLVRRVVVDMESIDYRQGFEQTACMLSVLLVARRHELAGRRLQQRPEMSEIEMGEQCPLIMNPGVPTEDA